MRSRRIVIMFLYIQLLEQFLQNYMPDEQRPVIVARLKQMLHSLIVPLRRIQPIIDNRLFVHFCHVHTVATTKPNCKSDFALDQNKAHNELGRFDDVVLIDYNVLKSSADYDKNTKEKHKTSSRRVRRDC